MLDAAFVSLVILALLNLILIIFNINFYIISQKELQNFIRNYKELSKSYNSKMSEHVKTKNKIIRIYKDKE